MNIFSKYCQWGNFHIFTSKCKCFGIKKNGKQSSQFEPYLKVDNEMIPAVKLNDSFVYLGKEFSFDMSNENVKRRDLGNTNIRYQYQVTPVTCRLNVKNLGIGLQLPSDIYRYNQITIRNILKSSKNQSMRELFEITGMKNIRNDNIVKRSTNAKVAKSTLDNEIQK